MDSKRYKSRKGTKVKKKKSEGKKIKIKIFFPKN